MPHDAGAARPEADPDPGEFCIKHRADWLSYALSHARNRQDAEDAVSYAVMKILQHHAITGTLCAEEYDPIAWVKTIIANYIKDQYRRERIRRKYRANLYHPPNIFTEDVLDAIFARQMFAFIKSLNPRDHQIAQMFYGEGLEATEISRRLELNPVTLRTSLWRTRRKIRRKFEISAEPHKISPGEAS